MGLSARIERFGERAKRPRFHASVADWGPFFTTFVYQALNVVGWFQWVHDERLRTDGTREDLTAGEPALEAA